MIAQVVENLLAIAGDARDVAQSLGQEDSLEKRMSTYSNILACKIQWTLEPGGLPSMGLHRVKHD